MHITDVETDNERFAECFARLLTGLPWFWMSGGWSSGDTPPMLVLMDEAARHQSFETWSYEEARDAAPAFTREQRLLLTAWHWPDRELRSVDEDKLTPALKMASSLEMASWVIREAADRTCTLDEGDERREWALRVLAHVKWHTGLSSREVSAVVRGRVDRDRFALTLDEVETLARVLHLEYDTQTNGWVLVDAPGLRREIEASALAIDRVDELRRMSPAQIATTVKRIPDAASAAGPTPPTRTSRYRPLYATLRKRVDQAFVLPFGELDNILSGDGEREGLPESARTAGWWTGTVRAAPRRPHLGAWLAAGYTAEPITDGGPVEAVQFNALPDRDDWVAHRDENLDNGFPTQPIAEASRINLGRRPGDVRELLMVHEAQYPDPLAEKHGLIHPRYQVLAELVSNAIADGRGPDASHTSLAVETIVEVLRINPAGLGRSDMLAELARLGCDVRAADTCPIPSWHKWFSSVLTVARRRGLIANHGTRSRPLWRLTPSAVR
ncbi:hypothetical protein ET495_10115 [Xylanimonas allomyrinae]|uniref:Uncharacterized protein n=1 Tax=Xylanimonas allomyrinae TaxID=2509459 RepID=A0A4P6EP58_9MICO|nr:hypothetical protein [Xylanimonas allomyrinae]QAY63543.1 hypothetical protein ET495_10115 [Xylanimonas allomyrinae]